MAMNTGPTDGQGVGGEIAGGDRGTGGIDRAEEARVGDVGSPHPVNQPDTAAEPALDEDLSPNDVALGGGVPSGEAPDTGGSGPGETAEGSGPSEAAGIFGRSETGAAGGGER